MTVHGAMFHHFHREGEKAAQGSITAQEFARALEFIGRERIISAQEFIARANAGTLKPDDRCITFDDNLRCQYDVALPVLEQMDIKAFFFIYSSVCEGQLEKLEIYRVFRTDYFDSVDDFYVAFERAVSTLPNVNQKLAAFQPNDYLQAFPFYSDADRRFRFLRDEVLGVDAYTQAMDDMIIARGLSPEQLAKKLWMDDAMLRNLVAKGHVVGLHSYSHPTRMNAKSEADQANEYRKNYDHIFRATGVAPISMSHPCNSYTEYTLDLLRNMGITLGFCANMAFVPNRGALEVAREDHANIMKAMCA